MMRRYLVETLAECGEFEQGIGQFEEALRIAEAVDQPFSLAAACIGGGELYLLKGDLAKAVALLRRALGACETWQIAIHWPQAASALGYACALSGDDGGTVPLLEQAVERAASGGLHHESVTLPRLGEAHLMAGRRPEAIACAERALELARRREERAHEAWALRLLGEIAARGQPPDVAEAEARYGEALAVAEALGMRPLAAHCHLGLGTLYGRVGRAAEARADLTAAAALYRAMDMMFWLARAEAAAAS